MIELFEGQWYVRLWREVVYLAIEDYLRNLEAKRGERYILFVDAKDFIYGSKTDYFNGMCMAADFNPSWVRKRINDFIARKNKDNVNWVYAPNLAERVLGVCNLRDAKCNYKRRGREIKLVKNG